MKYVKRIVWDIQKLVFYAKKIIKININNKIVFSNLGKVLAKEYRASANPKCIKQKLFEHQNYRRQLSNWGVEV